MRPSHLVLSVLCYGGPGIENVLRAKGCTEVWAVWRGKWSPGRSEAHIWGKRMALECVKHKKRIAHLYLFLEAKGGKGENMQLIRGDQHGER
jgi:hypothetical protein